MKLVNGRKAWVSSVVVVVGPLVGVVVMNRCGVGRLGWRVGVVESGRRERGRGDIRSKVRKHGSTRPRMRSCHG
jgi:hypothetical protein